MTGDGDFDGVHRAMLALEDDPNINWIRQSALTQRAFFIGIAKVADAVFPEHNDKLIWMALNAPMWRRSGDDPFPKSELGQIYSELKSSAADVFRGDGCEIFPDDVLLKLEGAATDQLARHREAFERISYLVYKMRGVRRGIEEITSKSPKGEMEEIDALSRMLEEPLRMLSQSQLTDLVRQKTY